MPVQYKPKIGRRGIEWCDETRNATAGCKHQCKWEMPDGTTAICYAKELAENGVAKAAYPHGFEHHYWRPHALKQLTAGGKPLLIFCDSMSDMFEAAVPSEHVHAILDAMRSAPHHTYQCLTKAAPMILKYLDCLPPNLWVGVSSPPDWFCGHRLTRDQQDKMLRNALNVLARVKAETGNIVWMSAEPVSWDLTGIIGEAHPLDWIVIGAASSGSRYFQPAADHIRDLLGVMDDNGTPVFFKGNIRPLIESAGLGRWREDFPLIYRDGSPIPAVAARQATCERLGWPRSMALPVLT